MQGAGAEAHHQPQPALLPDQRPQLPDAGGRLHQRGEGDRPGQQLHRDFLGQQVVLGPEEQSDQANHRPHQSSLHLA